MEFIPQVIFIGFLAFAAWLLFKRIRRIKHNIQIGRPYEPGNNPDERWQNMLLIAFGQKKMFKKWIPAFLHLFIYVGFIIINIEVLEIIIDGVTGKHRVFLPWLGNVYPVLISFFEFLALAVLTACTLFLIRRNILKVNRLMGREMTSWPKLDANLILIIEILLMAAILSMNATDQILQARNTAHYPDSGRLYFSSFLMPLFAGGFI